MCLEPVFLELEYLELEYLESVFLELAFLELVFPELVFPALAFLALAFLALVFLESVCLVWYPVRCSLRDAQGCPQWCWPVALAWPLQAVTAPHSSPLPQEPALLPPLLPKRPPKQPSMVRRAHPGVTPHVLPAATSPLQAASPAGAEALHGVPMGRGEG